MDDSWLGLSALINYNVVEIDKCITTHWIGYRLKGKEARNIACILVMQHLWLV